MKQKTVQSIEISYKNKIAQKEKALSIDYDKLIKDAEEKVRTKLQEKRNKKLKKYTALQERNKKRELKNLERKEKGHKIVKYKKKVKKITKTQMLAVLQKYARLRDTDKNGRGECIACGVKLHYKDGHGCHYISRQRNPTAYDLDNIHLGCPTCNYVQMKCGKNGDISKDKFRKNLIFKIGLEKVLNLEVNKSTLVDTLQRLTKDNYEYWLAKVKELEQTKTLTV